MTCELFTPVLGVSYELLEEEEAGGLRRHLSGCTRCAADRAELQAAMAAACPANELPPSAVWHGITAALEEEAASGFALDLDGLVCEELAVTGDELTRLRRKDPLVGARVGDSVVLERLGIGAMSRAVYRGLHLGSGQEIALELYAQDQPRSQAQRDRLERETQLMVSVEHPNVVRVLPPVEDGKRVWVRQEFVRGKELRELVRERGRCTPAEAVALVLGAARGVRAAHRRGVRHLRLEPSRILLTQDGTVKLTEFSTPPVQTRGRLTACGGMLHGNPGYMAPELMRGKGGDERADLYGLGAVFYELLTGRPPIVGKTPMEIARKVVQGEIARPPAPLNAKVERVLGKLLAKEPEDRYWDVDRLIEDLVAIQKETPVAANPRRLPWQRDSERRGGWVLGLGLVVLLVIAIALFAWWQMA